MNVLIPCIKSSVRHKLKKRFRKAAIDLGMTDESQVHLEVVYATLERQCSILVTTPTGATVRAAIERSRIGEQFPEIDLAKHRVGIYGRLCNLNDMVTTGDRVEIYQPLRIDPKLARRKRSQSAEE